MANLMSIFFIFFMKLKFWLWSEKHISRKIDRNLTVGPIELIEMVIELSISSLFSEHINKIQNFRKIFTKKEGGGTLKSDESLLRVDHYPLFLINIHFWSTDSP